jgi:hypothetical protein
MWAKGRFSHMTRLASKVKKLDFTHIEPNTTISPGMLSELLKTTAPIASIHSPCPALLSSKGIPVSSLSLSSLVEWDRAEVISFAKQTIDLAASVKAKAIISHIGEAPIDLILQGRLNKFHDRGYVQSKEYSEPEEEPVYQRISPAPLYSMLPEKVFESLVNIAGKRYNIRT